MNSNISKQEQKKNPQAVLDVLNWFDNSSKQRPNSKYMINATATHSGKSIPLPIPLNGSIQQILPFRKGSSLSRLSSSSPSSTPTDSESHHGAQIMHISESLTQQSFQSPPSAYSSTHEDDQPSVSPPPPIASRPERTKSIVSVFFLVSDDASIHPCEPSQLSVHPTVRRNNTITLSPSFASSSNSSDESNQNEHHNANNNEKPNAGQKQKQCQQFNQFKFN